MPRTSYKKFVILLAIITLGIFVSYYFVYKDIKQKNEHISALSQEITVQSSRQQYLATTEKLIENLNTDIDKMNHSIISKDGDVAFIESLEKIAKDNNISIDIDTIDVSDEPSTPASGITILHLKAKTKGEWKGMYTFLSQLESLPYKVKITQFILTNVSKSATDTEKASTSWQSSFDIRVLKYK